MDLSFEGLSFQGVSLLDTHKYSHYLKWPNNTSDKRMFQPIKHKCAVLYNDYVVQQIIMSERCKIVSVNINCYFCSPDTKVEVCSLEFVLGSRHCSKGSLWVLQFFSLCKNQHSKIPVQPGISGQGTTLWMCHC